MVKAVALNTIHVCRKPGVKNDQGVVTSAPEIDVVTAGSITDLDSEQFDEFEKLGAVRKANRVDEAQANEDGQVAVEPAAGEEEGQQSAKGRKAG